MAFFTEEQIGKLGCDAYAYAQASSSLIKIREDTGAQLGSSAFISLTTASAVNFCFALELQLKLILIKTSEALERQDWKKHKLYEIYELLSEKTQKDLDDIRAKITPAGTLPLFVTSHIYSKEKPNLPKYGTELKTFGDLLKRLDELDFDYTKARYSWEKYSSKEWFHALEFKLLAKLYDGITRYTNSLATP